jgi:ArsR family metal-binding transcriptional regulator
MLIHEITVIETSPCLAEKELFKALTRASADLTEILPYLNSILEKPNYQGNSKSLAFKKGIVGFTLIGDQINVTKFINITELHELLDWVKDLINDTHLRKGEITPNHDSKTILPALTIFKMLPKTNCKKCGQNTCLAFAGKLNLLEAKIEDCLMFSEPEYQELFEKLTAAMG